MARDFGRSRPSTALAPSSATTSVWTAARSVPKRAVTSASRVRPMTRSTSFVPCRVRQAGCAGPRRRSSPEDGRDVVDPHPAPSRRAPVPATTALPQRPGRGMGLSEQSRGTPPVPQLARPGLAEASRAQWGAAPRRRRPEGLRRSWITSALVCGLHPKQVAAHVGHTTMRMVNDVYDSFIDPTSWPEAAERERPAALFGFESPVPVEQSPEITWIQPQRLGWLLLGAPERANPRRPLLGQAEQQILRMDRTSRWHGSTDFATSGSLCAWRRR